MDDATFWRLIGMLDWDQTGDDDGVAEPVIAALASLDADEIHAFQNMLAAHLWELDGRAWAKQSGDGIWWGNDSLSSDGFLYARCVVVANGKAFHEAVRLDPAKMPKEMEFESLLYLAPKAFERKTGRQYDRPTDVSFETYSNTGGWT